MISNNLADDFGVLADTVEVVIAVVMIIGGICSPMRFRNGRTAPANRRPPTTRDSAARRSPTSQTACAGDRPCRR